MSRIVEVEVVAAGPAMAEVQFTDALPPVRTTVTYVVLTDDTGAVGVGAVESDTFGAFDLAPLEALRPVTPALVGQDPLQPSAVCDLVGSRLSTASRRLPAAAVEIACWDLAGQHAGRPLHHLLGGARDEVPAYASLPFVRDPEPLLALVSTAVEAGYPAVKLHVSGDPAADVTRVSEVRSAFPGLGLIVDAESVYDGSGAASVGRALDELGILWFEAPLPDRDIAGYATLSRSIRTPVVPAGGLIDDPRELALALPSSPWSAVRTQTMEGGVGHVREFAAVARTYGLEVELCSYGTSLTQAIDLHLILGLGLGSYYEQPFPAEPWAFGTTTPVLVEGGVVRAPVESGLGMQLDRSAIDAVAVGRFSTTGD